MGHVCFDQDPSTHGSIRPTHNIIFFLIKKKSVQRLTYLPAPALLALPPVLSRVVGKEHHARHGGVVAGEAVC